MNVAQRLAGGTRMGWRYMKGNLNLAEDGQFRAALDQEALYMGLSTQATALVWKASQASKPGGGDS